MSELPYQYLRTSIVPASALALSVTSAKSASPSGVHGLMIPMRFWIFFDGFSQLCSLSRALSMRAYLEEHGERFDTTLFDTLYGV